jgi:hypothetical protein
VAITFDSSILLDYYQGRTGQISAATNSLVAAQKKNPTAPWSTSSTAPRANELVRAALAGKKLVNEGSAQLDVAGASKDYQKLFALYQGLNTLYGLAEQAGAEKSTATERAQLSKAFGKGMTEVAAYAESLKLDNLRLTRGSSIDMTRTQLNSALAFGKSDTDVGVPIANVQYDTGVVHTGAMNAPVAGFQGDVQFQIMVKKVNSTELVSINLADMGATERTVSNVVSHINTQLQAAGAVTRFATNRIPGVPETKMVGGVKVTLSTPPDQWSLKVKGDVAEQITFVPVNTGGAVYMAQTAGIADKASTADVNEESREQQFLKFQTDLSVGAPPPPPVAQQGERFAVDGRVFAKTLDADVKAVRQTVTGSDGSVYMLADIAGTVNGQTIKGEQDVALLKYDTAGNLIYTRTLGAASKASGMALAVSADGQIAVAGSTTGSFQQGDAGADAAKSDSFVTLYDKNGDELWTQRRAAREDDEATSVTFAANGAVLVAGRAKSNMPGAASVGGWDGYVQSFTGTKKPLGGYAVTTNFVTQFGTAGTDSVSAMAVEGANLATVGIENGRAVLRRFDLSDPSAPILVATRDLGDLQGGSISGVAFNGGDIVVAGATRNAGLAATTVNTAHAGGVDAFVSTVSSTFSSGAGADKLNYFGGVGDDAATAMTVSEGKVWLAGSATNDLPGSLAKIGATDGYLVRMDASTGAVEWARRFSAKDGGAAPTSIAVDTTGASALDRFGLPKGAMEYSQSTLLTSATSVRAGDQFQIRTDEGGRPGTVTIEDNDTLQSLAAKIQRAAGFRVKVQIVKDGDVQRLQIKPQGEKGTVEILAGKTDRNALEALGLPEGVVRVRPEGKGIDRDKIYGMTLPRDLVIDTREQAKASLDKLNTALATIRTAYRDLNTMFAPAAATSSATSGEVPAYLKNQAANYQAALDRLLGSG